MHRCLYAPLLFGLCAVSQAHSQAVEAGPGYSRLNRWEVFGQVSDSSRPMFMGQSYERILAMAGVGYTRRLRRFGGTELGYHVEVQPVEFESDPVELATVRTDYGVSVAHITYATVLPCERAIAAGDTPPLTVGTPGCGRQWTFAQTFSPIGLRYALLTSKPVQPYLVGNLGYMYASRPIPVASSEAFNFVFDFGIGVEAFHWGPNRRSLAVEARLHHFSNRETVTTNPGVDNMVYRVAYVFGH